MRKTFRIPVEWRAFEIVEIEADSLEEAVDYIQNNLNEIPLGDSPEYVEDSYMISVADDYDGQDLVNYIKEYYNTEVKNV